MAFLPGVFGPSGVLSNFFLDPSKVLWALAFLIPLILLYLIRPRPVNVAVPSLMFILKDMGRSRVLRFFRTLFRDILMLLQLLAILLLALSLAKPFINVERESLVQQEILIVDASASTRAFDDAVFDRIKSEAKDRVSGDTVIIVSQATPIALEVSGDARLSAGDANDLLDDLEPTDTPGDLPAALDIAAQYAGPESKVTIITDLIFSDREDPELIEARIKILRSKGALVEILPVREQNGKNVGITDAKVNTENSSVDIKIQNFNDRPTEFGLEVNGDDLTISKNILAPTGQPGSFLTITVPVGNGKNEITLTPKDDFATDNTYYVSIPEASEIKTMIITNDERVQQSRLIPALTAAGDQFTKVSIDIANPPRVPDLEHDLYVIKDVNTQFFLPGVITNLRTEVEDGAILVVYAQSYLFSLAWGSTFLPVHGKDLPALSGRFDLQVNNTLSLVRGLSDLGQVDGSQLERVGATDQAIVYSWIGTNDGPEPVIAARRLGRGAVIYYGIKDRIATDLDPQSYAVLWGRIVDFALVDPMTINLAAGTVLTGASEIRTPDGKRDSPVVANTAGFYVVGSRTIATNLYPLARANDLAGSNEIVAGSESAINTPVTIDAKSESDTSAEGTQRKVPKDLSTILIIAGLVLLVLELVYVKLRGDL